LFGCYTVAALVWTVVLLHDPLHTDLPEPIFIVPSVGWLLLRLLGTAVTYSKRVQIGPYRTILAVVAGISLTHTVAKAVALGLYGAQVPFFRTPKWGRRLPLAQSILAVYQEVILAGLLLGGGFATLAVFGFANGDGVLWAGALFIQGVPYLGAISTSIISCSKGPRRAPAAATTNEASSFELSGTKQNVCVIE
jgi:hypothetical protein